MPRFVILEHDHPELHWDLMLETGTVLRTWRLAQPPTAGGAVAAMALADHRLHYLDYEGPVSGGRGTVRRWDCGEYEEGDGGTFNLRGARVHGKARLTRGDGDVWTFE